MKILLTGGSGFLGGNFIEYFSSQHSIIATYLNNPIIDNRCTPIKIDLSDYNSLCRFFEQIDVDVVVHLSALSNPNTCSTDEEKSYIHNYLVTKYLSEICHNKYLKLVFASTDLVYDGNLGNYNELSPALPINTYGKHKLLAEQEVLAHPENVVARLPLLFGYSYNNGMSQLQGILKPLRKNEPIKLFTDELRSTASAKDICSALMLLSQNGSGLYCLAGDETISRYQFGVMVCSAFGFVKTLLIPALQKDVNMAALRPRDVTMSNLKIKSIGWQPQSVLKSLEEIRKIDLLNL